MTELLAAIHALPGPLLLMAVAVGLTVESGLLVGVAIPGTAITLAAGAAAQTGAITLPAASAGAALGTLAGGQLGYWLGHRRRHRTAPFAGLSRLPTGPWPPLRRGIRQRPVATVLAAQWLASGRLLVPRAAGWSQMQHRRFTAAHTPSAIAWAATLTGTGYAATAALREDITLGLSVAAGAAVLLGLVLLLRQHSRRTPAKHTDLHHADPTCARHGVKKGQVDISAVVIRGFETLGWATKVRWPTTRRLERLVKPS